MSSRRLLYLVFFLAGAPALVYQVVWQRTLTLYFGVDIYSTSVTVATFLLGLGVGSLLGGRLADRLRRPLVAYAVCEALLGVFGALSIALFARVGDLFAGASLTILIPVDFALLLAPTLLMGMTLPLMCRGLDIDSDDAGSHFSTLYAVNTLGAAVGALASAWLLIGLLGLDGAARLAAALNLAAAALALAVARRLASPSSTSPAAPHTRAGAPGAPPSYRLVLAASFFSGFAALGYELVAYRLLTCLLHGTVYVFGTILFFFLTGIGGGSWLARRHADRSGPLGRFAAAQFGIAVYLSVCFTLLGRFSWLPGLRHLIGATALTTFHPAPELLAGELGPRSLYSLLDVGLWPFVLLGPPALLMGYGFPQLVRAGVASIDRYGRSVGQIYFANILGSTAGTLLFGFGVLHYLGSETALRLVVLVAGALAVVVGSGPRPGAARRRALAALVVVAGLLALPGPGALLRAVHYADFDGVSFSAREDRSGVVALRRQDRVLTFPQEARIVGRQRLLIDGAAHGGFDADVEQPTLDPGVRLALSAHPRPRRVLAIGLGDGKMCAAAALWPEVEEVVVVELNGSLAEVLAETRQGELLAASPKVRIVNDDGRRWLLANPEERFDLILSWPLHAAHAGSGNLFSLEFFDLLSGHLTDRGLVYLRSADEYSTARTIATSFAEVVRLGRSAYVAGRRPFRFDAAAAGQPAEAIVRGIHADRESILEATAGAPLNRDFHPHAEFYVTYPWAAVLATWGETGAGYGGPQPERFRYWVLPPAGERTNASTIRLGSPTSRAAQPLAR